MAADQEQLRTFAAMQAELDAGSDREEVIRKRRLTRAGYDDVERACTARLRRALEQEDQIVLRDYDDAYRAAWLALPVQPARQDASPALRPAGAPLSARASDTIFGEPMHPGPALPYDSGAPAAQLRPVTHASHPDAGATGLAPAVLLGDAWPFQEASPRRLADETAFLPAVDLDDPLPFTAADTTPAEMPARPVDPIAPHPDAGATAELRVIRDEPSKIPFPPVSPSGLRRVGPLSLQEAAALDVELSLSFGDAAAPFAAFQLDRDSYGRMRAEVARAIAADPTVAKHYHAERHAYAMWRHRRT